MNIMAANEAADDGGGAAYGNVDAENNINEDDSGRAGETGSEIISKYLAAQAKTRRRGER